MTSRSAGGGGGRGARSAGPAQPPPSSSEDPEYSHVFTGTIEDFGFYEHGDDASQVASVGQKRKRRQGDAPTPPVIEDVEDDTGWFRSDQAPPTLLPHRQTDTPVPTSDTTTTRKAAIAEFWREVKEGPDETTEQGWFMGEEGGDSDHVDRFACPDDDNDDAEEECIEAVEAASAAPPQQRANNWSDFTARWNRLSRLCNDSKGDEEADGNVMNQIFQSTAHPKPINSLGLRGDLQIPPQPPPQTPPPPGLKAALGCIKKWVAWSDTCRQKFYDDITRRNYSTRLQEDVRLREDCYGDKLYAEGLDLLGKLPITLTPPQKDFIKMIFNICSPHIYKDEFLQNKHRLLKKQKQSGFQKMAAVSWARQFGKSTTVSAAAAALLAIGRGLNVVVVANGQDIASKLMQQIMSNYALMRDPKRIIFQNRKMSFVVRADVPLSMSRQEIIRKGLFNTVRACSGNAKTQRGINADIIILDEAAYIPKDMIQDVIGPLVKVRNTVLVALSTFANNDPDNWFTQIMRRDDPQIKRLAKRQMLELRCEACKQRNFTSCDHKRHLLPAWHDSDNTEMAQLIIPNDKKFATEVLGSWSDSTTGALFHHQHVERIFARNPFNIGALPTPSLCLTFFDPKGNSERQSFFAVLTLILTEQNGILLVGFDELQSTMPGARTTFLQNYFTNLSNHPVFARSHHTMVVESNYAAVESELWPPLAHQIFRAKNHYVGVSRYNDDITKQGARTGDVTKALGASLLIKRMMLDQIYCVPDLVVAEISQRERVIKTFKEQMKAIQVHKGRKIHGKNSPGDHDDMAVGFVIATDIARRYREELCMKEALMQEAKMQQQKRGGIFKSPHAPKFGGF